MNLFTMNWDKNYLFEKDPYNDDGSYFHKTNPKFSLPWGWRGDTSFGQDAWLELHAYSRNPVRKKFFEIVDDSKQKGNKVLKLETPVHTDGIVLRSKNILPPQYRICVDVGNAQYDLSNYDGKESAEPWLKMKASSENGLYWLAILDDEPKPRNNVWIHHHRKIVIDSDNNLEAWTSIFNGNKYIKSGDHPVMMFALATNKNPENIKYVYNFDRTGLPFISLSNKEWQPEVETKEIRAVDAYLDKEWYRVCIEKTIDHYRLTMSGKFRYGGDQTYDGIIGKDLVYKGNQDREYFMLGDPHINFYEGSMLIDNITLEIPTL